MSHQPSDADIDKLPPPAERAGGMRIPGHRGVANLTPASHGEKDRAREASVKQLTTSGQGEGESESAPSDLDKGKDENLSKNKEQGKGKDKEKSKDEEESSFTAAGIIDTASNIGHKLMDAVMHPVQTAQEAVQAVSETVKNVISGDNEEQGTDTSESTSKSTEVKQTNQQQAPVALTTQDRVAAVALPEERRKVTQGDLTATKGHYPSVYHQPDNLAAQKHPNRPPNKYEKQHLYQPRANNF